jgi:GT2 family glycosyltransferase
MLDLTCSIVLYKNEFDIIGKTISSFLNTKLNVKLYLIDNSPTDLLKILSDDSRIEYFHNPKNTGFGAAHNIAIQKSMLLGSKYHLVLNPDIFFNPETLESIFSFMNQNVNVGHLMPKVLFPDDKFQFLCKMNPTFFDLFVRGFMPNFLKDIFRKRINQYDFREYNFEKPIFGIPYLSGCFMFFRTSTLKKVGLFDENIFMYLEDADITRRFLEISDTVYYPGAFVYHHYAGLTHKKIKYKVITIQSAIYYFNKWGWLNSLY